MARARVWPRLHAPRALLPLVSGMVWTQVSANLLIGVAYAAIAFTLAVLVRRIKNIPFAWVYLAFGTFILPAA